MRKLKHFCVVLVCTFFTSKGLCQSTGFQDNFNDHNLLIAPTWYGEIANFENLYDYLQSASDQPNDTFWMAVSVDTIRDLELRCDLRLPFSTSSANYVDLILASDSTPTSTRYFIRVGGKEDAVALYRKDNSGIELLASGPFNQTHNFDGRILVRRESGVWMVSYSIQQTGDVVQLMDTFDMTYPEIKTVGILIRQSTASFHRKHYFDNFYFGPVQRDTTPPNVIATDIISNSEVSVVFNEAIEEKSAKANSNGDSLMVIASGPDRLTLRSSFPFTPGDVRIVLSGIFDQEGNTMSDTILVTEHIPFGEAGMFDVLITEIMADPEPVIGLPAAEYLELYNATGQRLNISGYTLGDATSKCELPAYILEPGEYLALCRVEDQTKFDTSVNILGVGNFITLNNGGDSLWLRNDSVDIHQIHYQSEWHEADWKKGGGWSLEMTDVTSPCVERNNWSSSESNRGGTPGMINSVSEHLIDNEPPRVVSARLVPPNRIELGFDESIVLYQPVISDFRMNGRAVELIRPVGVNNLVLEWTKPVAKGVLYALHIEGVYDCFGNVMRDTVIRLAIPESFGPGEVLISEVLFNPRSNGVDFVEVYNPTDKVLTLSDLFVGNLDSIGNWKTLWPVSTGELLFFPKEYIALTSDPDILREQYPRSKGKQVVKAKLPSLPDEAGNIAFGVKTGVVVDAFDYREDMHYELLDATEGVSLERRRFDQDAGSTSNWTSASWVEGYATPGYQNSQFADIDLSTENTYNLFPDPVSPNGDGVDDALFITFNPQRNDVTINIQVLDRFGREVDFPVNMALCGESNVFVWDGITQGGNMVQPGVYIVYLEAFATDGSTYHWKKGFTVTR